MSMTDSYGRICQVCSFDQSVVSFTDIGNGGVVCECGAAYNADGSRRLDYTPEPTFGDYPELTFQQWVDQGDAGTLPPPARQTSRR
jgi:hypothetical protein